MAINFNVNPYYDDYDEDKGFHRVLFKPGVAVQARELTQLQTIMQKQVERMGNHFFEDGAMVIPGQIAIDCNVRAVKLTTASVGSTNLSTTFDGENKVIEGLSNGVEAVVLIGLNAEGDDPPTLIIRFTKNGNDYVTSEFAASEYIRIKGTSTEFQCVSSAPVTKSSIASIQEGVYYAGKNFVKVLAQTIALEKFSDSPSFRVGLALTENIITELDDPTLYDNAIGSPNESAPGADRYKIELVLTKLSLSSTLDQDFYELSRVENGVILKTVNKTQYSILEKTLARRTFDEAGNFTVSPFRIQVREHRNNNRGTWAASTAYIRGDVVSHNGNTYVALSSDSSTSTAPTHTVGAVTNGVNWLYTDAPFYNQGVYQAGSESKLAIGIEPGKAYINGYEIEKIATQFVPVNKARDTRTVTSEEIDTDIGNYVFVSNVYIDGTPGVITNYVNANLYNRITVTAGSSAGTKVGTATIRAIYNHAGNTTLTNSVFKVSLFNINLDAGKSIERDVKQIHTTGLSLDIAKPIPGYTSDFPQLQGTISISTTAVTGQGTAFNTDFVAGDYIYVDSTKELLRISSITNDYSLTLADSGTTATNSRYYRAEMYLQEPENVPAVFPMPYRGIKETTSPTYYLATPLLGQSTAGGALTFNSNILNSATTLDNIVVINRDLGRMQKPTSLTIASPNFTLNGLNATANYTVIAPVQSTTTRKTKTTVVESKLITNNAIYSASEISLDRIDVYAIDGIKAITSAGNLDISSWYYFDDGQRSTHYGISKLVRRQGVPAPTSNIRIDYRYFSHGSGNYFDASSYSDINYENIPVLYADNLSIKLSDVLDFRPVANVTTGRFDSSYLPHRDLSTTLTFAHYLPRIDKITMDMRGNIFSVTGAASVVPQEPENPSSGMALYKIGLSPYTINTKPTSVKIQFIDNKRYTMRDIAELEKRLQSVEYYTALSLLEQDTVSMSIKDGLGLERFKNGFIVDNFEGHGVGDVSSSEYRCSIDMEVNEMRPLFEMNNINLLEKTPSSADRIAAGYQVTGDLVTLRYTNAVLINQSYASRTENVNPFAVASFIGRITLNPPSDEWFENAVLPEVVINQDGNFDAIASTLSLSGALGTVWNAWQTQWTGTPVVTSEAQFIEDHFGNRSRYEPPPPNDSIWDGNWVSSW